jgi:hypothetical protein
MRRIYPLLVGILFLGCAILGYIDFQQKTQLLVVENDAEKQIDGLKGELAAAKLEKQKPAPQQNTAVAAAAKPPARPAGKSVQISDLIKDNPAFGKLYAKLTRGPGLAQTYGDGLNSLKLTHDQLSRLKDLLTDRQMSVIDAMQAASLAGEVPASPEWQQAINEANLTNDQEIKAILGPDAEATLANLKATAGEPQGRLLMQSQVIAIASDMEDAGVPLTADQSTALTQALLNAWYWQGKDLADRPVNYNETDPSTGLSIHDTRNITNATPVLTPDQMNVFRNYEAYMQQWYDAQQQYHITLGP